MRHVSRGFGGGAPLIGDFKIGATVVAKQAVIWLSTATGTVTDPAAVTDLTDAMGVVLAAAEGQSLTYSTTQGGTEGVATVIYDPNSIFEARVVPSATASTAYAAQDGYFMVEESGDTNGLTVTDTEITGSADDMNDGMLFGISGANVGQSRVMTDHTSTTAVVTVPFLNDIAVGDTYLGSQYAPGVQAVQMTTDFTQANGTIAGGTGGEARVVHVRAETRAHGATLTAPQLYVELVMNSHAFGNKT